MAAIGKSNDMEFLQVSLKRRNGRVAALSVVGSLLFAFAAPVYAQDATTADGVFTTAQAERAQAIYDRSCASCHGATLGGGASAPPLMGFPFTSFWTGKNLGELNDVLHTMPADNPGSLTDQQYADLIALILDKNAYPAGDTELPADGAVLAGITISPAAQ